MNRASPFFFGVVSTGIAVFGLYVFGAVAIVRHGGVITRFGWTAELEGGGQLVREVDPQGPAAGRLQAGDEVISVSPDARLHLLGTALEWRAAPPDGSYTVRVRRGGREHDISLALQLTRSPRTLSYTICVFLVSFTWYVVAMLLGILKPEQRLARLAALSGLVTALALLEFGMKSLVEFLHGPTLVPYLAIFPISPFHLLLGYLFYASFPAGRVPGRPWSALTILFTVWASLLVIAYKIVPALIDLRGERAAISFFVENQALFEFLQRLYFLFFFCALAAIIAVIVHNYREVTEPDQRRRLKWVAYGSAAGLAPLAMIELLRTVLVSSGREPLDSGPIFGAPFQTAILALVLVPLSFAYAIIRHRVFDIGVVVRRGVQYLLAKNALRILLALPVIGLAYTVISNRHLTIGELIFQNFGYLYLIAALAISLRFRTQLTRWVDRKFFREAFDREKMLLELLEGIDRVESASEVSRLVSAELELALHPKSIYVWYREPEKRDLTLAYSSSAHLLQRLDISADSSLVRVMEDEGSVEQVPLPARYALPAEDRQWLERLGISLIVPITGIDQRLAGMLMLGEKQSEEPYTAGDRKLLYAVAKQIAVVRENLSLKERVDHERRIKHDVLARLDQSINLMRECPSCGACYDNTDRLCPLDGRELTLSLPVDRTIDGKYRLDQLIGRGGMGTVYEAEDLRLRRRVAVKILVGRAFGNRAALRRFEREARTSAKLNHPNIVVVYDYGGLGGEGAYLVMERLHGTTLRVQLAKEGPAHPSVAAVWFDQALEALKAAHFKGVVHRDLKPENILITRQDAGGPRVKLLDFGLAKLRALEAPDPHTLTVPGIVMGTFGYMSPEQMAGAEVDERSDVYSVGVVVAETMTGRRPFEGDTFAEVARAIALTTFHLEHDSSEARRLEQVLKSCLAVNPAERYASIATLQEELIPAIRACPPLVAPAAADGDAETIIS